MKEFNANMYEEMYEDLWIDLKKLWCLMMQTETFDVDIDDDFLYYTDDKDKHWIWWKVCTEKAHITILYWLLESAQKNKEHINKLIGGDKIGKLTIESIDTFDSNYQDEPYVCIVAKIKKEDWLMNLHNKLELLPHINTFPEYKPHVTIAYVKDDKVDEILDKLDWLVGKELKITWIDYWK